MGRLHGAALAKRVEKQLREELMTWGIDANEYSCKVANMRDDPSYAFDPDLILFATFTRAVNGATIEIDDIYTSDSGEVMQRAMPRLC